MNQKEISKKLAEKNTEIYRIIDKIKDSLYDIDDKKNWGHIGDTDHVLQSLKEIEAFFCK